MTFQSSVAEFMGFGVPGEIFLKGPLIAQPGEIVSSGPNTIGFAFVQTAEGQFSVGGSGVFGGILANPKEYALYGTSGEPLAPTLNLPQYAQGAFVTTTAGMVVEMSTAFNIGDAVDYVQSGGALVSRTASFTPTTGTAAVASSVMTIASLTGAAGPIGVGAIVPTLHGPATVLAVLTGTGGNGTYTVQAGLSDSSATNITTPIITAPASGNTHIVGSKVVRYDGSAAGLAVVELNG